MRNVVLWSVLALILIVVNWQIYQKEQILDQGKTMLLRLAPRDPWSLLQGDYMSLNYALANDIGRELRAEKSVEGLAVVKLDRLHLAQYQRIYRRGQALRPGEKLLLFRKRGAVVKLASDAFFFQQGLGDIYRQARYGELRVAPDGEAVLVGLRDEAFKLLAQMK